MKFRKILSLMVALFPVLATSAAFAAEGEGGAGAASGLAAFAPGLTIAIAVFGGALGQGKAAAAALEGLSRNPQANLFVPMIIGLALIESLVIYALVVVFVKM